MTIDEFLAEVNKRGFLLSNMYQCDDGTWFVAVRTLKPEWMVMYGRDKNLEVCLQSALRQVIRGKANWPVDPAKVKRPEPPKKKKVERIRVKIERVRV